MSRLPLSRWIAIALLAAAAPLLPGADFGFDAIIRAGLPNNGDWELGLGPTGNNSARTSHLNPYYANNTWQRFEIGYSAALNAAFLRFYNQPGAPTQVLYANPFSGAAGANIIWEIPASGLYLGASSRNRFTEVELDQLSLTGTGLAVIQPVGVTALSASQLNSNTTVVYPTPITFRTSGGDWTLSGQIRFDGLGAYTPGGARQSDLHMGFNVTGTVDVPEPASAALVLAGVAALLAYRRWGRAR